MRSFSLGDHVRFTTDHVDHELTGTVVDDDYDRWTSKTKYTVSVDGLHGLLETTADKMRPAGRNSRGGAR